MIPLYAPRKELTTALAAFLAAMALVYLISPREFVTGDTTHYLAMVRGEAAPAPFGYRPLAPMIVAALPLSPAAGFFLVAYAATLGTLFAMRALFRHLAISPAASTAAAVFLCWSYPVATYLARWGRIDSLANFFFALSLLWILRRRFLPASVAMAVGVLAKETLLFPLPILFFHRIKGRVRDPRAWASTLLLCSLPIVSLVTIRSTIEVAEGDYAIESPEDLDLAWETIWEYNVGEFGLSKRIARDLTKSYGFFWALAALGLLTDRRLRLESLYLVAVGLLLCVVATDWARMLGTGYPGIFIPAALLVHRFRGSSRWPVLLAGLLALSLAQCYLSLLVFRDLGRLGQVAMMAGQLLVVAGGVGLAVWGYYDRRRSAGDPALEQQPEALVDSP